MADSSEPEPFDFRTCLAADEQLLWTGTPDPTPKVARVASLVAVGFLLFALVFGAAVLEQERSLPWWAVIPWFLMVGIGLFLLFGLPPLDRRQRKGVTYAVTDRRVLRADRGRTEVRGLQLRNIAGVELVRGMRHGTVRFRVAGDARAWEHFDTTRSPMDSPMPAFLDIADADHVAGLVERLREDALRGESLLSAREADG